MWIFYVAQAWIKLKAKPPPPKGAAAGQTRIPRPIYNCNPPIASNAFAVSAWAASGVR
jgi:hypothetical protein